MTSVLKKIVCDTIDARSNDLEGISHSLWNKPEVCFEEYHAHELLTTFLEKEGFKVEKKTPLETSFIAKFGDPSGLKVGVLCEYDALPGLGHGCGHNLIAEAGVAAALGIKEVFQLHSDIKAQVIVYGTPAEESGGGKALMVEKGSFNEADICMMAHPAPFEIPNGSYLARAPLTFTFHGKASHAAAAPWEGINALDAAVSCYNAMSMLRQQVKPTSRLHTIISDGGEKPNIIPERAELDMYVRGSTDEEMFDLVEKIKNCANGAAVATGCTVDVKQKEPCYSTVKTNKILIDLYMTNAKSLGVVFKEEDIKGNVGSSTDMGNVSKIKPSIHPNYKIKTEGGKHSLKFAEAARRVENQLPALNAAKSMGMTAIDVICDPNLMVEIRNDFAITK